MGLKQYLTITAGILVAALLFVPVMELADANDYNLLSTDPATGLYRYKPNSSFNTAGDCYENRVDINNLGFHGLSVSSLKQKDTFRIELMGSSYVSAIQVPTEDMVSVLLQNELNANPHRAYTYEVIPIGIGGQSRMLLDIFYYLKYGSALTPDLVIDIESDHELIDEMNIDTSVIDAQGHIQAETPKGSESPTTAFIRSVSRHSKLLVNLYNRSLVFKGALDAFLKNPFALTAAGVQQTESPTRDTAVSVQEAPWSEKEKMLQTFAQYAAKDNAQFVYATWSGSWAATSTAAQFPEHGAEIAKRNNFSYVDLVPVYRVEESVAGRSGTFTCDIHWNKDGNRYAADALMSYFAAHPALLQRSH